MSFHKTTPQMKAYTKNVTRRLGWEKAKPGESVTAIEKGQGLKLGEHPVTIHKIQIIHTRWEPLRRMIDDPEYGAREVIREGFPDMSPREFVEFFCGFNKIKPEQEVNRIAFRHLLEMDARGNYQNIIIPRSIAVCPDCKTILTISADGWEQSERDGSWCCNSFTSWCETEPEIDDREAWGEFDQNHPSFDMPYIYWMPIQDAIESYLKRTFRFEMKDDHG